MLKQGSMTCRHTYILNRSIWNMYDFEGLFGLWYMLEWVLYILYNILYSNACRWHPYKKNKYQDNNSVEAKPEQIEKKNVALIGLALLYLSVMFCLFYLIYNPGTL